MGRHLSLPGPTLSTVLRINANFLLAAGMGLLAWACWPASARTWWMAVLSGALAILAATALTRALGLMLKIYRREREIAAMLASGRTQHPADLASATDMRRAGMTDD